MDCTITGQEATCLDSLLARVYEHSGYDFRAYRRGTVIRRLARRLHATDSATYQDYSHFLAGHPDEYQRLADDLVIQVSGFFRSEPAFEQLRTAVLPALVSASAESRLTFWSAACAHGEEPYSLAMLIAESLGENLRGFDVTIHATDISLKALDRAQAGIYSPKEVEGTTPARLQKYFRPHPHGFQVSNAVRQMVRFSRFDLTSASPPPIKSDCILCCNVLIYFQKQLQERVLNMLHNALSTPGYLVLGEVESPAESLNGRLACLDGRARLYKKS